MSAVPQSSPVGMAMNPFPGLRPFREDEEPLFFGREAQVDMMVDKLAATRLLPVVGTSGCGKSSLVNCGLIPALHRGLMAGGSAWRVARLRPGNRPLRALAEALVQPTALGAAPTGDSGFAPVDFMEATLRLGRLGLVDAFTQAHLDARQRLLVVVDQFEELFRYQVLSTGDAPGPGASSSAAEDAAAFVNLLLQAVQRLDLPIHVVLTMRSDFLGDCAQFFGLPEAISRGQYLVPRMTREERRLAITGPLGVAGAHIDAALLTRLVNDVGDDPDQLSVLQHALHRTFVQWRQDGAAGPIELRHYEAIGTMAHALNLHAEEAYAALGSERLRQVCAALFKAITDKTSDARGTRRPTRLDGLAAVTGAGADELVAVIEVFREPVRSFLMPPAGVPLRGDTPIDIAHESLMRVWTRLRDWADEEARSAQTFRRLAETARLERAGDEALLRQPGLQFALEWWQQQRPTAAWAARYGGGLDVLKPFLDRSETALSAQARDEARQHAQQRRTRLMLRVVLPVVAGLVVALTGVIWLYLDADEQRRRAENAVAAAQLAEQERMRAEAQRRLADEERLRAEAERRRAEGVQQAQERAFAQATSGAPELRKRVQEAVQSQSQVYLQYADQAQRAPLERLRTELNRAGYSVPGAEQVSAVPAQSELRYFRQDDAPQAERLVRQLQEWGWGALKPRFNKGSDTQSLRQFEVWLARTDAAEAARLMQQLGAPTPEERKAAGQVLQNRYTAFPAAIALALALFEPAHIDALSAEGRINALYFLTRTAPLAWDATLEARGRQVLARVRSRANAGPATTAELNRLEQLLDAVRAGAPSVAY